jgi:Polyketide cyclase / dehydrase and lipid transport
MVTILVSMVTKRNVMSWMTEASTETTASPEAVWSLWEDVEGWPKWDDDVLKAQLHGPFETGSKGTLKPKGGPGTSFTMTEVVPFRSFTDQSKLPLATIDFHHVLHTDGSSTKIEHRVVMTGPLTFVFRRLIGSKIQRGLPGAVTKLARLAEAQR